MSEQYESELNGKGTGEKTDRRVVRTKRAIRQAVMDQMTKKPLEQITVTDIAREADINRKTFYTYYNSPDDVVSEVLNEKLKTFATDMEKFDFRRSETDPLYMSEYIAQHRPQPSFREKEHLLIENQQRVWEKMCLIMKEKARAHLVRKLPDTDPEKIEYVTEFMFSGYYHLHLLYWEKHREMMTKMEHHQVDTDFLLLEHALMKRCISILRKPEDDIPEGASEDHRSLREKGVC